MRQANPAAPVLRQLDSRGNGRRVSISGQPLVIGRGAVADVPLGDGMADDVHCVLESLAGMLFVRDLGSERGTWVNGRPVRVAELQPGDRVAVGLRVGSCERNVGRIVNPTTLVRRTICFE